jgi:hypothetical protein
LLAVFLPWLSLFFLLLAFAAHAWCTWKRAFGEAPTDKLPLAALWISERKKEFSSFFFFVPKVLWSSQMGSSRQQGMKDLDDNVLRSCASRFGGFFSHHADGNLSRGWRCITFHIYMDLGQASAGGWPTMGWSQNMRHAFNPDLGRLFGLRWKKNIDKMVKIVKKNN